jgi:hypothetical protein
LSYTPEAKQRRINKHIGRTVWPTPALCWQSGKFLWFSTRLLGSTERVRETPSLPASLHLPAGMEGAMQKECSPGPSTAAHTSRLGRLIAIWHKCSLSSRGWLYRHWCKVPCFMGCSARPPRLVLPTMSNHRVGGGPHGGVCMGKAGKWST